MNYDFDTPISRRGTNSYKWDSVPEGTLPLWVADMDFRTAPCIIEALQERVGHGVFGYTRVPDAYYEAINTWFTRRHEWSIDRESVVYTSGVVPALSAIIQALTEPGDKVLVQTPVYNCFFSSIRNSRCHIVDSPLIKQGDTYLMDFEDLERKATDPSTKLMLLCNPHNPAGRVWTAEELRRVGEICLRHDVFVVADEIHNEIVMPGHKYTPFATLGEDFRQHSASCISPSKAFNIAGLQIANIVCTDDSVRRRIDRQINVNEVCDVNPFGVLALQAAYTPEGEEWLTQLLAYLNDNYTFARQYIEQHVPSLRVTRLEGTYLMWVDMSAFGKTSTALADELLAKAHVLFNAGDMYDILPSPHLRINLACPRHTLAQALEALRSLILG